MSVEAQCVPARRDQVVKHLELLNAFIGSPVHVTWEADRVAELASAETSILNCDPTTEKDRLEELLLRGERRLLQRLERHFENNRETLKRELEQLDELIDNPNAGNIEPET